jgi:hypothetical protein
VCQYGSVLFIHLMGIIVHIMIFLKGSLYILMHTNINLRATYFGLIVVVESRLCQLHCRRPVYMIDSLNIFGFSLDLKKNPCVIKSSPIFVS